VFKRGRVFTVLSGKIDTVFYATERVLSMIEAAHLGPVVSGDYAAKCDVLTLKALAGKASTQ
jgi:hypothetical protein